MGAIESIEKNFDAILGVVLLVVVIILLLNGIQGSLAAGTAANFVGNMIGAVNSNGSTYIPLLLLFIFIFAVYMLYKGSRKGKGYK